MNECNPAALMLLHLSSLHNNTQRRKVEKKAVAACGEGEEATNDDPQKLSG